jgi:polyhydroxybutyrate depolymerase
MAIVEFRKRAPLPGISFLGLLLFFCFPMAASAGKAVTESVTVQLGTQKRTCLVHLPPAYDGQYPLPLVIALHGSGGTGAGMARLTGFDVLADKAGFIAAYPDGMVGRNHGWNALFGKPIPGGEGAQVDDVDDVGFIRALIDQLHSSYHTDPARVFVCGHSAGAYLSYRVAIDLADRIAAAGVVNGSMGIRLLEGKPSIPEIPKPLAAVSIIHICGAKDRLVKFAGGQTVRVLAKSVPECLQHFVQADRCTTPGKETQDAEHGLRRTLYSGGQGGTEVELVLVENGDHNWPTLQQGLATSQELWDFFSRHPQASPAARTEPPPGRRSEPGRTP